MIVPILSLIFVITFVAVVIVKQVKENIKEENLKQVKLQEHEAKLNSVIPGTILIKESKRGNPFKVEDLSSIKVLAVKRNSSGEIWVKYAYENIVRPGKYFESCPSYDSLENKLKLYPIIELPKEK
jgi:ABC-type uncharacterized transport system permease subunit